MIRNQITRNAAALLWAGWRRRYLILLPTLLMPFIGLAVGIVAPKKYETYTTILFQEAAKHNPFLEDLAVATNLKDRMEALNALLHSRHILADVAFKRGMITEEMPDKEKAFVISELSKSLKARLVGDDLIKISYQSTVRENMTETLKLVSLRFVERVLAPQRSSIFQSENFLENELKARRQALEEAEGQLADYKSQYASELPELHAGNVARLSALQALISERRMALEGARASKQSLLNRLQQTNPVVNRIEESIVEQMALLSTLRARYTDRHSKVQAAILRLESLEKERNRILAQKQPINSERIGQLWAIAANSHSNGDLNNQPLLVSQMERLQQADDQISALTEEVSALETEISQLSTRVNGFGRHERRLTELTREIEVKRKIYQDLAERHQLARVTGALGKSEEGERVKLIDPPFEPVAPINLPLLVFVLAGTFGGLALGIGLATVVEFLDTSVRRRKTLIEILDVPVLARIPPLPEQGKTYFNNPEIGGSL